MSRSARGLELSPGFVHLPLRKPQGCTPWDLWKPLHRDWPVADTPLRRERKVACYTGRAETQHFRLKGARLG